MAEKFGLDAETGALRGDVRDGDPADQAGIRAGDVIVELDGEEIKDPRDLLNVVARKSPGSKAEVKIFRGGKELTFTVTMGERPSELQARTTERSIDEDLGLAVQEITPELAERFKLSDIKGVIVADVKAGSPAQKAGLRPGDIIREVERNKIENFKDYKEALKGAGEKKGLLFWIQRGKNSLYVVLALK